MLLQKVLTVCGGLLPSLLCALSWQMGPFHRADEVNPIIMPTKETQFFCPFQNQFVTWESDHTFNPAAVVKDGKIHLFYRAEDNSGSRIGFHTSRIGLAISEDGLHFERSKYPILYPNLDMQQAHEWPGGCEDPRIVESDEGLYVMTYTQWNRDVAVLGIATSMDLLKWKKHGYAFAEACDGLFPRIWSKSGSIICRQENDKIIATKIEGKYWMYWGEGSVYVATSDDLINWSPMYDEEGKLLTLLSPRPYKFDSRLVEAGPPALITKEGIVLLYNGKNAQLVGDPLIGAGAYSAGQALMHTNYPWQVLARSDYPFFKPEREFETTGQYKEGTVFIEGLVHFKNKWFLYYGTADSLVGVTVCEDKSCSENVE